MSNKHRTAPLIRRLPRQQGFTIIEMVVAIVVIGVGVAGVMAAFTGSARGSVDPMLNKTMQMVAEEIMEEILLKPYAGSNPTKTGCVRNNFNKVSDYDGYATTSRICDVDGVDIASLNGYSLSVVVATPSSTPAPTLGGITEVNKITVTVSRGSDSFRLVGWRTNYAQ